MSAFSSASAMAARLSSAARLPISGSEPAPCPCVSFSPIWIFWAAPDTVSACLSVLTEMKSTSAVPEETIRLTTLLPAPPMPITLMVTTLSVPSFLIAIYCNLPFRISGILPYPVFYNDLLRWSTALCQYFTQNVIILKLFRLSRPIQSGEKVHALPPP